MGPSRGVDKHSCAPQHVQGDVSRSVESLRLASKHITEELKMVVERLLRHKKSPTQQRMLEWFAGVIEHNGERAKMQVCAGQCSTMSLLFVKAGT